MLIAVEISNKMTHLLNNPVRLLSFIYFCLEFDKIKDKKKKIFRLFRKFNIIISVAQVQKCVSRMGNVNTYSTKQLSNWILTKRYRV